MRKTAAMESRTSPAPGIIPEPSLVQDVQGQPASPTGGDGSRSAGTGAARPAVRRNPLGRVLAALRAAKSAVDADPPAESATKEG